MQSNKINSEIKKLGTLIRNERKAYGLTQSQLAEIAGCGLTFVSQLENGKGTLQVDKILNVLKVLGIQLRVERGKNVIDIQVTTK